MTRFARRPRMLPVPTVPVRLLPARMIPARMILGLLVPLLLAGCVAIPTSGRVVAGGDVAQQGARAALRVTAAGPADGADERQVVEGFLAAVAGLDDFVVARQFLAPEALSWRPGDQTVVHADVATFAPTVRGGSDGTASLAVQVDVVARIDEAGRYVEQVPTPEELEFDLVRLDGQWRIAGLPPGVLVAEVDAARVLRPFEVYFLDPTRRYLVPDVRWFPQLTQSATSLVRALLGGPSAPYLRALVSAAPAGTRLDLPTVQVVDGVATVDLTAEVLSADPEERALLQAQLRETLRAVPGVSSVTVTVDGSPLDPPDGPDLVAAAPLVVDPGVDDRPFVLGTLPVAEADLGDRPADGPPSDADPEASVDPAVPVDPGASPDPDAPVDPSAPPVPAPLLLGEDGRPLAPAGSSVLRLDDLELVPVPGTDALAREISSGLAVTQDGSRVAGLDAARRSLWVQQPGGSPLELLSGRGELIAPSFDPPPLAWVWTVEAGSPGTAQVPTVLAATTAAEEVEARWLLPGDDVRSLRVSRDGTRVLVVVAHLDGSVDVQVRGIRRDPGGRPLSLSLAAFAVAPELDDAVDAAWVADDQVVVLGRVGEEAVRPVLSRVGGTTDALAPTPGAVSVSAGSGVRSIVVGTADGTVLRRSGSLWLDGPRGVSPVFPG